MARTGLSAARLSLLTLLAPLLLGACAELTALLHVTPADPAIRLGPPLEQFAIAGRLTLTAGERRDTLRFEWDHGATRDRMLLMSPLGQGLAELERDSGGVRLRRAAEPPVEAENLRELAHKLFGASVPLEHLADWLRGAHAGPDGRVENWEIRVTAVDTVAGSTLPRRLDVRQGDIALQLVVDRREGAE